MNQIIKKCINTALLDIKKLKEYKFELLSQFWIVPFRIIIYVLLWLQIFRLEENKTQLSTEWVISYFVILCIIEIVTLPYCTITYELMEDVRTGNLDNYLMKPYNYFIYRYFNHSFQLLIGCIFLSICLFFSNNIKIDKIFDLFYFYFVSTIIIYLLFALAGLLVFIVENVFTFRDNLWNIIKLFSGAIIPLSFYPEEFRKLINYLPFRFIYDKPITTIISSSLDNDVDYVISITWIIILTCLLTTLWKIALKYYSSQGG